MRWSQGQELVILFASEWSLGTDIFYFAFAFLFIIPFLLSPATTTPPLHRAPSLCSMCPRLPPPCACLAAAGPHLGGHLACLIWEWGLTSGSPSPPPLLSGAGLLGDREEGPGSSSGDVWRSRRQDGVIVCSWHGAAHGAGSFAHALWLVVPLLLFLKCSSASQAHTHFSFLRTNFSVAVAGMTCVPMALASCLLAFFFHLALHIHTVPKRLSFLITCDSTLISSISLSAYKLFSFAQW